jgi:hypothetical protein
MTAQFLYDLRTLTGFVSGQDLQNLFHALGLGYCPKGRVEVNAIEAMRLCPGFQRELYSKEWLAHAEAYTRESNLRRFILPKDADFPLASFADEARRENAVATLVAECENLAWAGASGG